MIDRYYINYFLRKQRIIDYLEQRITSECWVEIVGELANETTAFRVHPLCSSASSAMDAMELEESKYSSAWSLVSQSTVELWDICNNVSFSNTFFWFFSILEQLVSFSFFFFCLKKNWILGILSALFFWRENSYSDKFWRKILSFWAFSKKRVSFYSYYVLLALCIIFL